MRDLSTPRASWALLLAMVGLGCDPDATEAAEMSPAEAQPHAVASPSEGQTHAAIVGGEPADGESAAVAAGDDEGLHLRMPPMRSPMDVSPYHTTPTRETSRIAQAFQFDAPVYHRASATRRTSGLVRRNTRIAVDRYVTGDGCAKSWYALVGGGFVCTGDGWSVSNDPSPLAEALQVGAPAVAKALPYDYAKLKTPAPLYWRLPTVKELATGAKEPVREQAQGAHFVAMDQTFEVGDTTLRRTVRGYYVRHQDLDFKPLPTMHGELLSGAEDLPLAFVHVDEGATLLDPESSDTRGTADKFARFAVERIDAEGSRVIAADGFAVKAEEVRVARVQPRPEDVGPGDKWIHIDLDQQTLVAYEGDTPVLATLVSSGKEGFEPPLGVFPMHKKYTTVTMSGPDPDAGTYAVEQVPWTMYYWGSYALHGAYWHDTFGNVRSHGCTNIPPIDARWLFYWSEPGLNDGWHAKVGIKGPSIRFARSSSAATASAP